MKKLAALTLSLFLTSGIAFADSPKDSDAAATKNAPSEKAKETPNSDKSNSAIAAEIEELRQTLQSQQEQLQLLKEELAKRDRQIDEAREAAAAANSRANEASVKAGEAVATSAATRRVSATISNNAVSSSAAEPVVAQQVQILTIRKSKPTEEGPGSIRFKGISLTPGGFIAAETVYRNHATSGDIATPFTGIPFSAANLSHVSENQFFRPPEPCFAFGPNKNRLHHGHRLLRSGLPRCRHYFQQPPDQQLRVSSAPIVCASSL